MNIIVTGARGFIGTHVCKLLAGHDVTQVDCLEPRVHGEKTEAGFRWCRHVTPREIADADVVIHLAAQVGVVDSMTDPLRYVLDNTTDTAHFAERLGNTKVVVASSMSVYGDPGTPLPITEEQPVNPASVYGLTKYDQEMLCRLLAPNTVALRFFNVYGPGQCLTNPYTGVLAIFANRLMSGEPPIVYEDGQQTRDFVYVSDVAEAVVRCAIEDVAPGVYNVCTGTPSTIRGVAYALRDHLGGLEPEITGIYRAGDIRHCIGDSAKLRKALPGWAPRPFEDGAELYAEALCSP